MATMKVTGGRTGYSKSTTVKEEYKTVGGAKVDYSKYFLQLPDAPKYYYPTFKTDSQMIAEAKNRFDGLYDTYINNSKAVRDFNVRNINAEKSNLDYEYNQRLDALKDNYRKTGKTIMDNAVKTGMGRSSFLIDTQNENNLLMQKDVRELNRDAAQEKRALDRKIDEENMEFDNQARLFNAKRNSEITSAFLKAQSERDKEIFQAEQYNQKLFENYQKLVEDTVKHNFNVQKYIDTLNTKKVTVTTTTRISSSTSYKADNSVDRDRIVALWNSLSGTDKIKYVEQNKNALKKAVPDLYGNFASEAARYSANYAVNNIRNAFM